MNGAGLFVVVVAGTAEKVGKSTIANNLAVYLKAINEDLPVTVLSFSSKARLDEMFGLGEVRAGSLSELFTTGSLENVACMGQFGVEYLSSCGPLPSLDDPAHLRRIFAQDGRYGIVVIDSGDQASELWRSAIWAADLVLSPVCSHGSLSRLSDLRRTLIEGGGCAEMLWLLPSRIGTESAVDSHPLLRLAADERGCQVLAQELSKDQRVHLQATGKGQSVLTRLPGSYVHDELRQLAEFVLQRFLEGPSVECRTRRMLDDGLLPQRARRVDPACPICGKLAVCSRSHYLEALPKRFRCLLHAECLALLLEETSIYSFLPLEGQLLIRTGIEGRGLRGEIRLLLLGKDGQFIEQQQFVPEVNTGWGTLLRTVTGRGLNEQTPGLLAISIEGGAVALLTPGRHSLFAKRRRKAFRKLHSGEGF
ncbi:MAG TPA: hypothetical protein VJ974_01120 [Geopsychrobacteraceae bacterium]|nr:hypothetical protein [Geopsychrobacteraceae bacterium]